MDGWMESEKKEMEQTEDVLVITAKVRTFSLPKLVDRN